MYRQRGRAVQTAQSLDEGLRILVHLDSTNVAVENNNGHLVYLQGQLNTEKWGEILLVTFSPLATDPEQRTPRSKGQLLSPKALVSQISDFRVIPAETSASPTDPSLSYYSSYFYHASPHNSKVGDIRVKFEAAGILPGSDIGPPTDEVFLKKHASNTLITWAVRFCGWLLMFVGFGCLTNIITTLVDWIPLVHDLVAVGVGTLNAALSTSLALTIIALGWIRYRPWLGFTILLLSVAPYVLARIRRFSSPASTRYRDA